MAKNRIYEHGRKLSVEASHPASPKSGQPLRFGQLTGVALVDERDDGTITVDFGPAVYDLKVKGENDAGNTTVTAGDQLYYVDGDIDDGTGTLSKKNSGYFFGFAIEGVTSGATDTIMVMVMPSPGPGTADILAGAIGTNELADDALAASEAGRAKMADDYFNAATLVAKFVAAAFAASADARALFADDFFTNDVVNKFADDLFAANATSRAKFEDGIWNAAKLADAILTGQKAAVVADANEVGGLLVLHRIDVADASGDTDVTLTHKTRIIDAWGLNTGGAAHNTLDTWKLVNVEGSADISDAVAKSDVVNAVKRVSTIDPAEAEIGAGNDLRITAVKETNAAVTVYVLGIRVA